MALGPSYKWCDPGCVTQGSLPKPFLSCHKFHLICSNSSLQLSAQSSCPDDPSLPKILLHNSLSWGTHLHPFFITLNHLYLSCLCGSFIVICPPRPRL